MLCHARGISLGNKLFIVVSNKIYSSSKFGIFLNILFFILMKSRKSFLNYVCCKDSHIPENCSAEAGENLALSRRSSVYEICMQPCGSV